jgi:hypothetical protein
MSFEDTQEPQFHDSLASVGPEHLPIPEIDPLNHRVAKRIKDILGQIPSRPKMVFIAHGMGWGPLGRAEKRIKAKLLVFLENKADLILRQLVSEDGVDRLTDLYAQAKESRAADVEAIEVPCMTAIPIEATIDFLLNRHPDAGDALVPRATP